jgi:molybdopterin converting factor small subunit
MSESPIVVRYWAAARTAAGVSQDELPADGPLTLAEVVRRAVAAHPGTRLAGVLEICSVLVGDRPVATQDPATVEISPGQTVEFLPPFAGG